MPDGTQPILLAGGSDDPHLNHLHRHLVKQPGANVVFLSVGKDADPSLTWELASDTLFVNGEVLSPRAVFIRYDVFSEEHSPRVEVRERAHAWYAAVMAWVECHPEATCPNRRSLARPLWKPAVLCEASRCGLAVPETFITNDIRRVEAFAAGRPAIAKPIDGGDYCRRLGDVIQRTETKNGVAASPAIVQPELVAPDIRIYGIGSRFIAFRLHSDALDYRTDTHTIVEHIDLERTVHVRRELTQGLSRLMTSLGLDFCAADFKASPEAEGLLFLEINDAPMFASFDVAAGGALADAIADFLGERVSRPPVSRERIASSPLPERWEEGARAEREARGAG